MMVTTGRFEGNMCPVDRLVHSPDVWVCEDCGGVLQPIKFSIGFALETLQRHEKVREEQP
jgi:hypothetical protein